MTKAVILIFTCLGVLLSLLTPFVTSQALGACYPGRRCIGIDTRTTEEDCCANRQGLSFLRMGVEGCVNCPIIFGFQPTTLIGLERQAQYSVEVGFITGGLDSELEFQISPIFSTASALDFTLTSPSTLTFPSLTQTNQVINFDFVPDNVAQENDERLSLELVLTRGAFPAGKEFRQILNLTIQDATEIYFQTSRFDYSITEGEAPAIAVEIERPSDIVLANPVTLSVTPLTISQAIAMRILDNEGSDNERSPVRANIDDFNPAVLVVIFDDGLFDRPIIVQNVDIGIVDDDIDESEEQRFIVYLQLVAAVNTGLIDTARRNISILTIVDNDNISVTFQFPTYTIPEPEERTLITNIVLLVKTDNQLTERTFGFVVRTSNMSQIHRSATSRADSPTNYDYTALLNDDGSERILVLPPNATSVSFDFFLNSDSLPEALEAFTATATSAAFFPPLSSTSTLIIIDDNDIIQVGFEQTTYLVPESSVTVQVCVVISNPPPEASLTSPFTLDLTTSPGSADNDDFMSTSEVLRFFPSSERRLCVDIEIVNDILLEANETFEVAISQQAVTDQPSSALNVVPSTAEVVIIDNDRVEIGFSSNRFSVTEGDGRVTLPIILTFGDLPLGMTIPLLVTLQPGTATSDSDYIDLSSTTSNAAITSSNNSFYDVGIQNDQVFEVFEEFIANLEIVGSFPRVSISTSSATVGINDNDRLVVGFSTQTVTAQEASTVDVPISVLNGTLGDGLVVVVRGNTNDNSPATTATVDVDYSSVSFFDIEVSSSSGSIIQIIIAFDNIREPVETIEVAIVEPLLFANGQQVPFPSDRIVISPNRAIVNIQDSNEIRIGFLSDTYTISEGQDVVTVEVGVLEGRQEFEVTLTVEITLTDRTAEENNDFQGLSSAVFEFVIGPDSQTLQINIPIIADEIFEQTENFLANLDFFGAPPPRISVIRPSTTITVLDDDVLEIGFLSSVFSGREDSGTIAASIGITSGAYQVNEDISIPATFTTAEGTATASTDYITVSSSALILLSKNTTSGFPLQFSIPITDDLSYELLESFTATFAPSSTLPDRIRFNPTQAAIEIIDDDEIQIGFLANSYSVLETDGTVQLDLGLTSGILALSIEIVFSLRIDYISGTATAEVDFRASQRLFNITLGPSTTGPDLLRISVIIINDLELENEEFFTASLNLTLPDRASFGNRNARVTIVDNEELLIGFLSDTYTATESIGEVQIQFGILGPLAISASFTVEIQLSFTDGSAELNDDYQASTAIFTITSTPITDTPTRIPITVAVSIINDVVFEVTETFQANLALFSSPFGRISLQPAAASLVITDDDRLIFSIIPNVLRVPEDVGTIGVGSDALSVSLVNGTIAEGIAVILNGLTNDNGPLTTATAGADYDSVASTAFQFTSAPFTRSQPFLININDDSIQEGTETVEAVVIARSITSDGTVLFPDRITIAPNTSLISIVDNDETVIIGFLNETYTVLESSGFVTLEVGIISESTRPISVTLPLAVLSGSAFAEDDYLPSSVPSTITVTNDNTPVSITIQVVNDNLREVTEESFFVELAEMNLPEFIEIRPSRATVIIIDDDTVEIGFLRDEYVSAEEDGEVVISIGVTSGAFATVLSGSLQIQLMNGTAVLNSDFTELVGSTFTVTLGPSTSISPMNFPISIINDDILEGRESFTAKLIDLSPLERVTLSNPVTTITIIDGDNIAIGFSQNKYTVSENSNSASLTVEVTSGSSAVPVEVVVEIRFNDRSAISNEDYIANTIIRTITFGPSSTSQVVSVSILNDAIFELTEEFTAELRINRTSLSGVSVSLSKTTICILDEDELDFGFFPTSVTVPESIGTVTLNATLLRGRIGSGLVILLLASTDDTSPRTTATAGQDYNPVAQLRLEFRIEATSQPVSISIIDDTVHEQTELLEVSLSSASVIRDGSLSTSRITTSGSPAQVLITDDDSRVIKVNDTVSADPLFNVPIRVSSEQLEELKVDSLSLCYEVHGQQGKWFNLVSDECTSINAHYSLLTQHLNVINKVGIRAVDNRGRCINILVEVDQCLASINGVGLSTMSQYSDGGVSVKQYQNRIRVSVPNCADITLVVWVVCEQRRILDPKDHGVLNASMLKLVVMRGLNFGHRRAHGLLGQFWNIPVSVERFMGLERGSYPAISRYIVRLTTNNNTRRYTGRLRIHNWAQENYPCLYVGDKQSGPIYEVPDPNDPVIEGTFRDYEVQNGFSEQGYTFGLFSEDRCMNNPGSGSGSIGMSRE